MTIQETFLNKARSAAAKSGHIFPDFAACEAALESGWGQSKLAVEANNLFGQKQSHPAVGASIAFPTKEYAHGAWMTVPASWIKFTDWQACFAGRMALLSRLARAYPPYAAALAARDGGSFVTLVSKRWSTDPSRAAKVLDVWKAHSLLFSSFDIAV